jgi:hypothetical protein
MRISLGVVRAPGTAAYGDLPTLVLRCDGPVRGVSRVPNKDKNQRRNGSKTKKEKKSLVA